MTLPIDVLVGIDTETIALHYVEPSQDPKHPTALDPAHSPGLIYAIVRQDAEVQGHEKGPFRVQAFPGDVIRWRETSLSMDFEESVFFYDFSLSSDGVITTPMLFGGVKEGGECLLFPQRLPDREGPSPPWTAKVELAPGHFWQGSVLSSGKVTAEWRFGVADSKGKALGYFSWKMAIRVVSK